MPKTVHTEHCCVDHGCKYGDDDCPVWLGTQRQSYPCETCDDVGIKTLPPMPSEDILEQRKPDYLIDDYNRV